MKRLRVISSLLVLLLGCCAAVAQPQTAPAESSITITGRVQSQGKPLSGALVTLWQQSSGGDPTDRWTVARGRTDNDGNYELKNVPTGNYFIAASAPGFVSGKENDFLKKLRYVTVVGGTALNPFNFDLVREGVITGTVTDADGKPLSGIPITLTTDAIPVGSGPPKYAENLRTDEQGRYRISGMPAGKYRLAAGHWPLLHGTVSGRLAYRRVFYPKAFEEAEARMFDIAAGSEVSGIDFNLGQPAKTFTARARVIDERTGKPVEAVGYNLAVYLNGKRIGGGGAGENKSNERGEIVFQNVPSGEYSISIPGAKGYSRRDDPQTPNYFGESPHFQVTDSDVADIEVRVTKAASVAGFVVVEGPAGADVLARVPEMFLSGFVETDPVTPTPILRATIKPDGSFLFTGLRAGKLKLNFHPPATGKPLPINLVRIERDGVSIGTDVEVQLGDEIKGLRVVMAYATGGVHGVVKLDDGSVPQGLIGLASVWQGNKPAWNRSVVNQNGEFILQNLVAGEYELMVAAHDAAGRYWQVKQKIKIDDDKVSEAKMVFDSKVKPNPDATQKSYLQP
jgi:protocatechuate 3,4-dioxygenase beta subunit